MSFDSSRFTFNPWNDFAGVVMQQGRVQLDSDWNEWLAEIARRTQAGTLDILGRAVVPTTTPDAFQITITTASDGTPALTIGPGRMYVDGLLAENHGLPVPPSTGWTPDGTTLTAPPAGLIWDSTLAELTGSNPIPYTQQPYLPGPQALPTEGGPFLVYLDVWHREITLLEYPDLVEKAVGVDTTGRIQLVWQVKLLDLSNSPGTTCSTPDSDIPGWSSLLLPPGPLLTTGVVPSTQTGPCCLAPNTGYTGLENQLYRVEIHQPIGGNTTSATFKWSRDNASVSTGVTSIAQGGTSLIVQSVGKDDVLRFSKNDWVEITDDFLELNGLPGELHQIKDVTDASSTITLFSAVSSTSFPVDANGLTTPSRHTRLTRWDQQGIVYQSDGTTVWADLTAAGATGDIRVPPAGTSLILEDGVTISFDQLTGGAPAQPGQFWTFAARTADGTVEFLDQAPPRGIHHHVARLAVVTLPNTVSDCRTFWPPFSGATCCDCTVNVSPSDLHGDTTLQVIVDRYQNLSTRTTFCFAPGTYNLAQPVRLTAAHTNFVFQSCQKNAAIFQPAVTTGTNIQSAGSQFLDGLFVLDNTTQIAFEGLAFSLALTPFGATTFAGLPVSQLDPQIGATLGNLVVSIGVRAVEVTGLTVEDCTFTFPSLVASYRTNAAPFCVGIFATGRTRGVDVEGCTFTGAGAFSAGFLLAPWAQFAPPQVIEVVGVNRPGEVLTTTGLKAKPSIATKAAPRAASQVATRTSSKAAAATVGKEGLQQVSQTVNETVVDDPWLNNILAQGTTGTVDASQGGSALPGVLHDAIFRDNLFTRLTVAALVLGKSEIVEFLENELDNTVAGLWLISPVETTLLLYSPEQVIWVNAAIAAGYPLPAGDASAVLTINAAPASARILAESQAYTDSQGNLWSPDTTASIVTVTGSSTLSAPVLQPAVTNAMPASTDQALYQGERWGTDFSYTFTGLQPGFYTVTIKLAEVVGSSKSSLRIFNVLINGIIVLTSLDLLANGAAQFNAVDFTFTAVRCTKDQIVIEFQDIETGLSLHAKCSAIQVLPNWGPDSTSQTLTTTEQFLGSGAASFLSYAIQLFSLAQQAFALVPFVPIQLRVEDNEMRGLRAFGLFPANDDQVEIGVTGSMIVSGNRMTRIPPAAGVNLNNSFSVPITGAGIDQQANVARNLQFLRGRTALSATPDAAGQITAQATTGGGGDRVNLFIQYLYGSVVFIWAINRTLIVNNMILNQGASRGFPSLIAEASAQVLVPEVLSPIAELMISGNNLRGGMLAAPIRAFYLPTVPVPMNTWEFLNTVILS